MKLLHPLAMVLFISLLEPAALRAQPSNDLCANAISISVNATCAPQAFSSVAATSEPALVVPNPVCGFYNGGDVWFTFTVPASGSFRIETSDVQPMPAAWELYSGACGNFQSLACKVNSPANLSFPGLAGQTLYLRVWRADNAAGNAFSSCVFEISPPVNDQCAQATEIDISGACTAINGSSQFSTAESEAVAPQPFCGFYEGGDVWYKFTAPAEGHFEITKNINPSAPMVMEGYSGSCGNFEIVFCIWTVNSLEINEPSLGGQELYVRVFRPQSAEGGPFDFCVQNLTVPENGTCVNAIGLPVGEGCNPQIFESFNASNDAPVPTCGIGSSGALWYSTVLPADGRLRIQREDISGSAHYMALFRNGCSGFIPVACTLTGSFLEVNNPMLAGETLHLVVYTFPGAAGGIFSLCAIGADCSGTFGGSAFLDACGECVGGSTGISPCAPCTVQGGIISTSDPVQSLCVGDGNDDFVQISVTGNAGASRFALVVPGSQQVVASNATGLFNMELYPAGNYQVRHVSVNSLSDLQGISNGNQLNGCFSLSNGINIQTTALSGGSLSANGSTILCDGSLSFSVTGSTGPLMRFVLLNANGTEVLASNISGTFNFTDRPGGTYRVVHIAYAPSVNLGTISPPQTPPCVAVSNSIVVNKTTCSTVQSSPNPAYGVSRVEFIGGSDGRHTLEVFDLGGRRLVQLFDAEVSKGEIHRFDLNTAAIPNGVYLYRLSSAEGIVVEKFMVAH